MLCELYINFKNAKIQTVWSSENSINTFKLINYKMQLQRRLQTILRKKISKIYLHSLEKTPVMCWEQKWLRNGNIFQENNSAYVTD